MANEYFSDLNYTLANEDTSIEYMALPEKVKNVFCIAGSGSRLLPLLAKNPENLVAVDMAVAQLYLAELRVASAKTLSYEEWLYFLGYRGAVASVSILENNDRQSLFQRLQLSEDCRRYWQERVDGWQAKGFILLGKWENHFQVLGRIFRQGLQCDFQPIFESQGIEEQKKNWEKYWPKMRFSAFMKVAASDFVFNKFLYKGHFAGSEGHRTEDRSPARFLTEEFERIFHTQLVRKNYFMQVLFLGRIVYEEGLPLEANREIFEKIKLSRTKIEYRQGNLVDLLPTQPWDFVSLSDTISYLPSDVADQILQNLSSETKANSQVLIRSFLRAPRSLNDKGWQRLTSAERQAHEQDATGVYQFHIFKKES